MASGHWRCLVHLWYRVGVEVPGGFVYSQLSLSLYCGHAQLEIVGLDSKVTM